MDLQFLGGASTVTGSRFLLTTARAKILIDCGMFQGSPNETVRNRIPLGHDPAELDAILITHAHLDHCGLLPVVVREGFAGPIYLTSATAELAEIVLMDSGRLQEEFAKRHRRWERRHPADAQAADAKTAARYRAAVEEAQRADEEGHVPTSIEPNGDEHVDADPDELEDPSAMTEEQAALAGAADAEVALRNQPPALEADLDEPLYDEDDAKAVPPLFKSVRYGKPIEVAPGIIATFDDAGHILGSAIIRLEVREEQGGPATTIVFSGDLGRPNTPIIRDPTPESGADYVVCESTYGGREHEPADEAIRIMAEVVRATDDAGGVLLIPSFAIGRTQEIVWQLDRLIEQGRIPMLPLYLDSPMARKAGVLRRGDGAPARGRKHAARLPEADDHPLLRGVTGDRGGRAAVHDRRLQRHAHGRPGGGPPAEPHRRPYGHDPLRRLPGPGHARRAPPGRRQDRQAGRPGAGRPLQGPLDQRLLGPLGRVRAARLAAPLRRGPDAGLARLPSDRVPRPW